jgi:hypothetical protein
LRRVGLAVQLLGCAAAVLVISLVVRGDTSRSAIAASTAVLATAVVSLAGLQGLWPTAKQHFEVAKQQRGLSDYEVTVAGGRALGVNADFVEWAVGQTAPTDRWVLASKDATVMQWLSYRMLPRLATRKPRKGTVIVFYGTTPEKAGYAMSQLSDLRSYQPTFSIARLNAPRGAK